MIAKPAMFPCHLRVIGGDVQGDVTTLIDTGSSLNVIHPVLARRLERAGAQRVDESVRFATASGKGSAQYYVGVTVVMQGTTFKPIYLNTKFAVANVGDNLLLGS